MILFGGFYGSFIKRLLTDNPPFYPLYGNFFINRKLPILVDINNLMTVYLGVPHLRLVIDKKADMFKNMKIKLVSIKDEEKEIDKHPVLDLLNNPDPLHSTKDWLMLYSIYKDIYNQVFIYKLKGTKKGMPKCLWQLPPGEMKITPTGKLFQQTEMENIIKSYTQMYALEGQSQEPVDYEPNQIIHITEGTGLKYIVGESKILTLRTCISNIDGALKTRNILIHENAGVTIMSPDSKDSDGAIPLDDTQQKKLNDQWKKNNGLNDDQNHKIFSTVPIKVTPLIFPVRDMLLFEEVEDDFSAICGAYGMSRDLFPGAKVATAMGGSQNGTMQQEGEKRTYQDTIIPEAEMLMNHLNRDSDLRLQEQGLKLCASYDHLSALQVDQLTESQSLQAKVSAATQMLKDGVIDHETYAEIVGVEMTGDKVIQSNNPKNGNEQPKAE